MKNYPYLCLAVVVSLSSCNDKLNHSLEPSNHSASNPHWSDDWLNSATSDRLQKFHSEVILNSKDKVTVEFESSQALIIGFVVRDSYEVTKSKGMIYIGSSEKDLRGFGATVGTSKEFTPVDGKILVMFENDSTINTSIAVYTSNPKETSR